MRARNTQTFSSGSDRQIVSLVNISLILVRIIRLVAERDLTGRVVGG